ncbi:MAG: phosphoadenosine phosphosulfate reductase family protein, partial [Thermodesulfobacteriota bacterium]
MVGVNHVIESYDLFDGRKDKIEVAIARFKEYEPEEGYYLAFSGGKDSVVIKALADMAGVKYDAHYNVTTVDPPELVRFTRKYHPDVVFNYPEKSLPEKIMDKGFLPLRTQRWCCEIYKEQGGSGRLVVTGIRAAESLKRSKRQMIESCYKDGSKRYLNAIIDWTDADVWNFIKGFNIPYCSLYDEGFKRLGCILCPMASPRNLQTELERWPKIVAAWRRWTYRLFERDKGKKILKRCKLCKGKGGECCDGTGKVTVIKFDNFKTAEDLFNWWLTRSSVGDPDQTVLFE